VADSNEYMTYAERCLTIARTISSRKYRIILREMAAKWTKLIVAAQLGPFPTEVQSYTTYAAGVSGKAQDRAASLALLKYMNGQDAASVLKAKGIDPG
jgi:hypothetical protein